MGKYEQMIQFLFCTLVLYVVKLASLSQSQIHVTTLGETPRPFWGICSCVNLFRLLPPVILLAPSLKIRERVSVRCHLSPYWSVLRTVGSRFTTGLRSRIFCCKSNRRKTSTI